MNLLCDINSRDVGTILAYGLVIFDFTCVFQTFQVIISSPHSEGTNGDAISIFLTWLKFVDRSWQIHHHHLHACVRAIRSDV